jgi:cytochrome P450
MEYLSNFWLFVVGTISVLLYLAWLIPKRTSRPPGPPNWPIVGSLFYLSKLPHRAMEELAKKYGPILYLRLGYLNHIVISNGEMALEVLKTHDANFASRPSSIVGKYAGYEYSDIVFAPYGDNWRLLRKICVTELLTQARIKSFEPGRQEEVARMVENIAKHNQEGKPMKMRHIFHELTSNNICRMLFGKYREKSDCFLGKEFDNLVHCVIELGEIGGKFNIGDLIPILKPFDVQGIEKKLKHIQNQAKNSLSIILNMYRNETKIVTNSTVTDFVETLLSYDDGKLDERSIMGVLTDLIGGGTDSSAITMEWALTELIRHPKIMKRAQEELDAVVGRTRPVLLSDLPNLPYLHAIIKETFRLHPPLPLMVPHFNTKDVQILNYKIPANTTTIVNIWAIGRDSKVWRKPLEFDPDRFFDSDIKIGGSSYNLLPFGAGRRRCPGMDLAQHMLQYGLATILHAFDWSPQPNIKLEDMNMMETFGAICPKVEPLVAIAKPRLSSQIYKRFT